MYIKSLELDGFRNYKDLKIEFSDKTNILYGDNAQGKTNILEAIYLCGTTKSHRTSKDKELINFNSEESHIRCFVYKEEFDYKIDIHLKKNKSKGIAVNGNALKKARDIYGIVNCILFSPEDLNIIKNGPSERRRFIDIIISQLDKIYLDNLIKYNKILDNRNKLLKDIQYDKNLLETLEVWDSQLVYYGNRIINKREQFITELNDLVKDIHKNLTGGEENLVVEYEKSVSVDDFEKELKFNQKKDLSYKNTSIGPHRDDLLLSVNGIDIRKYGSQGQQRTTALSLKLSEIELVKRKINTMPVLLLDDVLSELDSNRQIYLLNSIKDIQTIITCTGLDNFVKNRFSMDKVFKVCGGTIIEEN